MDRPDKGQIRGLVDQKGKDQKRDSNYRMQGSVFNKY